MRGMKGIKRMLLFMLVFSVVFSMAACGGGGGGEQKEGDGAEYTPITICMASEPESMDPNLSSTVDGATMLSHLFEGLIKYEDDGNGMAMLVPGTAEKWDISEDGLTWTFHLRKDAVWSDGQPVTSKDFLFSWNRLVAPETAAEYAYLLDIVARDENGNLKISAPDDSTFEVTLLSKAPYFEEICAFPSCFPLRQDIIEANGEKWTFSPDTYISNGSYTLKEWNHNADILMEKSDTYYGKDKIMTPSLKFALMDDANAIFAGYRSGDLNYIQSFPQNEIPALKESGDLRSSVQLGTYYVTFNNQKAPFDNPKVREAFSLAIDRNYIVEKITQTGEAPADGFVPLGINDNDPNMPDFRKEGGSYYSVKPDDYASNQEKAKQALADAGYPEGKGFPVVEYAYNTDARHKAVAEVLQNMWQTTLGVTVTLQNQDWNTFIQARQNGNYQIARDGWIGDFNDPITFLDLFLAKSGNNDPKYNNPAYDKIIDQVRNTSDQTERMKLLHQAEDMLFNDSAIAPIYFYVQAYISNLEGWYSSPMGYLFFDHAKIVKK